jgi:hypothetical protein
MASLSRLASMMQRNRNMVTPPILDNKQRSSPSVCSNPDGDIVRRLRDTGLKVPQTYSRWLSQCADLSSGGHCQRSRRPTARRRKPCSTAEETATIAEFFQKNGLHDVLVRQVASAAPEGRRPHNFKADRINL